MDRQERDFPEEIETKGTRLQKDNSGEGQNHRETAAVNGR